MKLMSSADYASTPASGHRHEEAALPRDIDHRSTHNMAPSSARVPVNGQNGIAPQSVQDRTSAKKAGEVDPCPYDLSREDREQIYHIATAISFRRGTTIFSQGADAHFIYFIDQGIVRLSRFAENGHRQVLGFQVPGDLIGLADTGQYANLAETVCPVQVHRIAWSQMLTLMLAEPKLQLAVLKKVVHDSLQAQSLIMVLGQQNTHQRLASCLVNLLRVPQFFDEPSARLRLPVNRFDLADYLGVTSRSAERAFARLEQQGLIHRITPRVIEILDLDGLERLQLEQRRSHH
jgi:CRP-like cAMP-binding protein